MLKSNRQYAVDTGKNRSAAAYSKSRKIANRTPSGIFNGLSRTKRTI